MNLLRGILIVLSLFLVSSCKLKIVPQEGGNVTSSSGTYTCDAQSPCSIDITDTFFDETFTANAAPGYEFHAWRTQKRALCAGRAKPCSLSTTLFGDYPALMDLLASDEVFFLNPVFVKQGNALRVFKAGNRIKYRGMISRVTADGEQTDENTTAVREFYESENKVDGEPVMLHQFTIRLNSDGSEFPEASYYYQTEGGAWIDVTDTGGNFIVDSSSGTFGALGYPSPLVPDYEQEIPFRLVSLPNISTAIATGTLHLSVSKASRIDVPLGVFRALQVTSTIALQVAVGDAAGARLEVVQKHWVAPHIGPIKMEFSQRSYDNLGNYTGTFSSLFEAVTINF
jgi:hypothetical protein